MAKKLTKKEIKEIVKRSEERTKRNKIEFDKAIAIMRQALRDMRNAL